MNSIIEMCCDSSVASILKGVSYQFFFLRGVNRLKDLKVTALGVFSPLGTKVASFGGFFRRIPLSLSIYIYYSSCCSCIFFSEVGVSSFVSFSPFLVHMGTGSAFYLLHMIRCFSWDLKQVLFYTCISNFHSPLYWFQL